MDRTTLALSLLQRGDLESSWNVSELGIEAVGDDRSCSRFWSFRFLRTQIQSLRGQGDDALRYLDSLGNPCSQDIESVATLSMHRGYLLALIGQYDSSRAIIATAETLASASGLLELQNEIRVRQAAIACLQHDLENAQKLYRSLVDEHGGTCGEFLHCVALAGVGNTLIGQKQYADALSWFGRALAIATSESFGLLHPSILGGMGVCKLDAGDADAALELHLEADRLLLDLGVPRTYLMNLSDIGNVYLRRGDYGTAIAYYHRVLRLGKELKFTGCTEKCTLNIRLAYDGFSSALRQNDPNTYSNAAD